VLRHLADLIAGGPATTLFRSKGQEQAHRRFLNGVKDATVLHGKQSAEGRGSHAQQERAFALVLMDLDASNRQTIFRGTWEGDLVLQRVGHILETIVGARECSRAISIRRRRVVSLMQKRIWNTRGNWPPSCAAGYRPPISVARGNNISAELRNCCYTLHWFSPQGLIRWRMIDVPFQAPGRQCGVDRRPFSTPKKAGNGSAKSLEAPQSFR